MTEYKYRPITSWALEDRPREKALAHGIQVLSDSELIAILLGSGTRSLSAVDLAKEILVKVSNNLDELGKMDVRQLMKYKGIGMAKALTLSAALELGRRRKSVSPLQRKRITCSRDAYEVIYTVLDDLNHEQFWVILLNRNNKVLDKIRIGQGGVSAVVVDPKIVFKEAINRLASGIILVHNHPSGNLNPSKADVDLTRNIRQAGQFLDIQLFDHLIIAGGSYYSFADEGML